MRATSYEKKKLPTNNLSLFEAACKLLLSQRLQGRWRTSTDLSRSQALSSYTEVLKKEYLQPRLPWQDAMISAIADTCSVRLDKTNKKVYRFRALVFHQGKPLLYTYISQCSLCSRGLEVVGARKNQRERGRHVAYFLGLLRMLQSMSFTFFRLLNSTKRFSVELRNRIQYGLKARAQGENRAKQRRDIETSKV